VILRLANGDQLGTRFLPVASFVEGRKRYLLAGRGAVGKLNADDGAVKALRNGGSLLPVGLTDVDGQFERGDTISVVDRNGREVARGLTNYSSTDLKRIRGQRSENIEDILGYVYGHEVIHRDNMVLL
jgi:glutamate 5-kinase